MTKGRQHSRRGEGRAPVEPPCPAADPIGPKANRNDPDDRQFGLRVEADRTWPVYPWPLYPWPVYPWTVYHVFSGIQAKTGGDVMSGFDRREATSRMLSLNRPAMSRSGTRAWVKPPALDPTAAPRK